MSNILSNQVKVFPAANRTYSADVASGRFREENIIKLITSLANADVFVITGLEIGSGAQNNKVSAGKCCIHGYVFDLAELTTPAVTDGNILCLKMTTNVTDGVESLVSADTGTAPNTVFSGLSLESLSSAQLVTSSDTKRYYYLPLAIGSSLQWVSIYSDDGSSTATRPAANKLMYSSNRIQIEARNQNSPKGNQQQDLTTFLSENICINDGTL